MATDGNLKPNVPTMDERLAVFSVKNMAEDGLMLHTLGTTDFKITEVDRIDLGVGVVVFTINDISPNYYVLSNGLRLHMRDDGTCVVNDIEYKITTLQELASTQDTPQTSEMSQRS